LWWTARGTGEDRRARDSVRLVSVIEIVSDARVRAGVDAWDGVGRWRSAATARDVDLCALHVELCARIRLSGVQCDQFMAEEVISVRDAARDRERDFASVRDHLGDRPCPVVEPVLVDLEPPRGGRRRHRRVWHFSQVRHDRSKVACVDWILAVR